MTALSPRALIQSYTENAEQTDLAEFIQELAEGATPEVLGVMFAMLTRQEGKSPTVAELFAGVKIPDEDIDGDFTRIKHGIVTTAAYPRGSTAQEGCLQEVVGDANEILQSSRTVPPVVLSLAAGVLDVVKAGGSGSADRLHALDDLKSLANAAQPPTKRL